MSGYTVGRRRGRIFITCACGTRSQPLTAAQARRAANEIEGPLARFTFGKCRRAKGNACAARKQLARKLRASAWLLDDQQRRAAIA